MTNLVVSEWLEKAFEDFLVVDSIAGKSWAYAQICYHSQQAAEKYLKAILVLYGDSPDDHSFRSHSISGLIDRLSRFVDIDVSDDIAISARLLTSFEARSRYPGGMLMASDAIRAVEAYNDIIKSLQDLISAELPLFEDEIKQRIGSPSTSISI